MTKKERLEAEIREARQLAYESVFLSIVSMLETYAGMAADYGIEPVTVTPSGDMETDIIAMHRAVHAMAGGVLALVDTRPAVTN